MILAEGVSIAGGFFAGVALAFLFHEWGILVVPGCLDPFHPSWGSENLFSCSILIWALKRKKDKEKV